MTMGVAHFTLAKHAGKTGNFKQFKRNNLNYIVTLCYFEIVMKK